MNFKSHTIYPLPKGTYVQQIFEETPTNAFFSKGECGNGASSGELTNRARHSLFVTPSKNLVASICKEYEYCHPVDGDSQVYQIEEYLLSPEAGKKLVSTPDSVWKIIEAAQNLNMLSELYRDWFYFLDESHIYITEDYRDILSAIDHFFDFDNKCMVSATPLFFGDPRMKQLDHYEFKITESLGTVNLMHAKSINGTLQRMIEDAKLTGTKLFIFYNNVNQIAKLIKACGLNSTNCNVHCADDEVGKNRATLAENSDLIMGIPTAGEYKLINFFTTAHFEGWNLKGESDLKMIVVSDVSPSTKNTLLGIVKYVQAFGRWRKPEGYEGHTPELYHIFNHRNIADGKSLTDFTADFNLQAEKWVKQEQVNSIKFGSAHIIDERLEKSCRDPKASLTIDPIMIDRLAYKQYTYELYNNAASVQNAWIECNYNVIPLVCNDKWTSRRDNRRIAKEDQLKHDYNEIKTFKDDSSKFSLYVNPIDRLLKTNPLSVSASLYLPESEMEELNYNPKKVSSAIFVKQDASNMAKVLKLVDQEFKRGNRYTKSHIKSTVQAIYDRLELRDKTGKPRSAVATHIEQFFEVKECKVKCSGGKLVNGFELIRPTFSMVTVSN